MASSEFTMPRLAPTMASGTILRWLVADGATVRFGDPVVVVVADDAETEVVSRFDGVLRITGVPGSTYACGEVIAVVHPAASIDEPVDPPYVPQPPTVEGDLADVVPLTADIELPVPAAPIEVDFPPEPVSASAMIEQVRLDFDRVAEAAPQPNTIAPQADAMGEALGDVEPIRATVAANGRVLASPRARAHARELGFPLTGVVGTGPSGRIVHDDVVAAQRLATERLAAEAERAEAKRAEAERAEAERAEAERAEAERAEAERLEAERHVSEQSEDDAASDATAPALALAEFLAIDLAEVPAPSTGRITRDDVGAWVRAQLIVARNVAPPDERLPSTPQSPTTLDVSASVEPTHDNGDPPDDSPVASPAGDHPLLRQDPVEVVSLDATRRSETQQLHAALRNMAQVTLTVEVDMTAVNADRERRRASRQQVPGYTAWVVAATAQALDRHPRFNSELRSDGLAVFRDVHIGVSVALDDCTALPVIEHSDVRSVEEIHQVLAELTKQARHDPPPQAGGSTFTVTALGMFGVDAFTPIIQPANTATLGVGRLRTVPLWHSREPTATTLMTLSLTWDQRAHDPAVAAEFAQTIVRTLETPTELV